MSNLNQVYGLWCTCHPERGIKYVGQTIKGAEARFMFHRYYAGTRYQGAPNIYDYPLYRWMRKHSVENIFVEVLEVVKGRELLNEAEVRWIEELGTFGANGLNQCAGGTSVTGYTHSALTREKMSGRSYTDETRLKMSLSAKKRGISENAKIAVRLQCGELSPRATSTAEEVASVKYRLWSGESVIALSRELGWTLSKVSHISTNVSWQSVPWPIGPRSEAPTKELMRVAALGRKASPEARENMSRSAKKLWTPERRKSASAAHSGSANAVSKLTDDNVIEMRGLYSGGGWNYETLGRRFGVSAACASKVCRRLSWKHLP